MPKFVGQLPQKPEDYVEPQKPEGRLIHDVTFFGDSSIPEDGDLYKSVWQTARLLALNGYAIVNGGGPGVMKAATDGAESVSGRTIAVYWQPKLASIFEGRNLANVVDESAADSNYMMRTLGLIEKGQVYVVCKGGTGTISEFGMVWALAKLYYGKHKPVILFGDFWQKIVTSLQENMILDDHELGVLHYASTPEEVLELVQSFELEVEKRTEQTYEGDETPFVLAPRLGDKKALELRKRQLRFRHKVTNTITQKQLEEFKDYVQPPARVLVVGCGSGLDLNFLSQNYAVTAIDNNPDVIEIARFENPNADVQFSDIRTFSLSSNTFKGIWMRDAFHHLQPEDAREVLTRLVDSLVEGGVIYLIVREGQGEGTEKDMFAGKEVEKYYKYYTDQELRDLTDSVGLETLKIEHVTRSHNWLVGIFKKRQG